MCWENAGDLVCSRRSSLIAIDAPNLAQVLVKFDNAFLGAVVYGRHFLLTSQENGFVSDLGHIGMAAACHKSVSHPPARGSRHSLRGR